MKNVFESASKEAEHLKDEYVSVEHLLLGIIKTKNRSEKILKKLGFTDDRILTAMREISGAQ